MRAVPTYNVGDYRHTSWPLHWLLVLLSDPLDPFLIFITLFLKELQDI